MKIVPYRKGFGCKKNDKDNLGIAGATNEVATLKEAVAAAERNAKSPITTLRTSSESHLTPSKMPPDPPLDGRQCQSKSIPPD